jgi:endonuclease/exonuclease/phosphatase family metal-dependent hydrolase
MRVPFLVVAALVALQLPRQTARESDVLTVMTFNIQHGMTAAGRYDLDKAVAVIAALNPDVVGLQETTRNHPKYNCDDQPKRLADALTRTTGRQWHALYEQEWFTPDTSCRDSGRGDGKETEGLTILSPGALEKVSQTNLWNTRIGLAARTSAAPRVTVAVTHLASGTAEKPRRDRTRQLDQLFGWARGLGDAHILLGDFNLHADSDEYASLTREHRDAWAAAAAAGTARGIRSGDTRVDKPGRIDYVLYTPSLRLQWVDVVDTKALVGSAASDHYPVVAGFSTK